MAKSWQQLVGQDLDVNMSDIIAARQRFYGNPEQGIPPLPFAVRTWMVGNFPLSQHFADGTQVYLAFETPATEANQTKNFK